MKALLPLNPKAPAFSSASSKEPYLLYPPPEISPAFSQHPHNFLYPHPPPRMLFFNVNQFHPPPPPPPHMFFFNSHFPFHPPIKKPAKVFSHGDVKARKPIKPFPRRVCYRKCLPPRLLKKQVWVTRNRNLSAKPLPVEDEVETPLAGKTSVMVRNIPNDFGRSDLLRILDKHCRKENKEAAALDCDEEQNPSSYDFLYLPMDFVHRANLGYAFVNFTSSVAAARFHREFDNFFWTNPRNKKVCQITVAKFQGKEELSQHFKDSRFPCHTNEYLPVVLSPPSDGYTGYNLKTLGYRVGLRGGPSRRA